MNVPDRKKVKVIPGQTRLYRTPRIKLRAKKRSRVLETIPIVADEKTEKELDRLDRQWEMMFFELKRYKEKHGHCNVPKRSVKYYTLGRWCGTQKWVKRFRPLKLHPDRERKLNEIGFRWYPLDEQWEKKFAELSRFKDKYGHCDIGSHTKAYYTLRLWCTNQRILKGKGFFKIKPDRLRKLNEIGFNWEPLELRWKEKFAELIKYKATYGHCRVRRSKTYSPLADWCRQQRMWKERGLFKSKPDRLHKLNEIGFYWEPYKNEWEEKFAELTKFKEKWGHCLVAKSYKGELTGLRAWVVVQRRAFKHNNRDLTPEKIEKLNRLGFAWKSPNKSGSVRRISNKELLDDLRQLRKKLNKMPSEDDIIKYGKYGRNTYIARFGSIITARQKAGFYMGKKPCKAPTPIRVSNEKLLDALKKLQKKLHKIPSSQDIIKYVHHDITTYWKRFGTISNARKKAGMER